jgi:hypothetical protein
MTLSIRDLHLAAFGERVAAWYDEAADIWRAAYEQASDPPVLLLSRGGYSGWGKSLADAGPTPIDGRLTRYLIRLFANHQTQIGIARDQHFRRDLIAHELGHVYEREVLLVLRGKQRKRSTHDSESWRQACTLATPYMLPELVDVAAKHGVTVADVFALRATKVKRCNGVVTRVPIRGALPVTTMARWPHEFRTAAGSAAFAQACETVATQQRSNVSPSRPAGRSLLNVTL